MNVKMCDVCEKNIVNIPNSHVSRKTTLFEKGKKGFLINQVLTIEEKNSDYSIDVCFTCMNEIQDYLIILHQMKDED